MELHEIQEELAKQAESCAHDEYRAAFDYVAQITHQSLLRFINFNDYVGMLKEVHRQVVDAPNSEYKEKLNTLLEGLFEVINKEIEKAQKDKESLEA